MKVTQSSWMFCQNILFIEFLFSSTATYKCAQHDSIQITSGKKCAYHDFEPNINVDVNLKFQQTKSTNSIFNLSKRSDIKVDSKEIQKQI
jgi:hypothetical protein